MLFYRDELMSQTCWKRMGSRPFLSCLLEVKTGALASTSPFLVVHTF